MALWMFGGRCLVLWFSNYLRHVVRMCVIRTLEKVNEPGLGSFYDACAQGVWSKIVTSPETGLV
jgi:hypothetical protein